MNQAWLDSCLAPIAGDSPAGRDARHEPEHERVRLEIENATALHGKAVDWPAVLRDGQALLANKSKDLLIASYMALAAARQDGIPGLTRGLALLSGLLESYSEGLFPQRARARGNALGWLSERVAELTLPEQCPREQVDALKLTFRALNANMRDRLGDDGPSLTELGRLVDRLALSAPEAPPPAAAPVAVASAPAVSASAADDSGLVAAIPGAAPAGSDASQDDLYFAVQAEVDKLQSLDAGKPDWPLVESHAVSLLRTQTKDFVLASYLTVALAETRGIPGLGSGLDTLTGLVQTFWEQGFPALARVKRRVNTFAWLIERVAALLPRLAPYTTEQRSQLDARIDALAAAFEHRLPGNEALSLAPWRAALPAAVVQAAPPAEVEVVVVAPVVSEQPPELRTAVQVDAPAAAEALTDVAALDSFLSASGERLVEASRLLFDARVSDPRAYRLLRIGLWLELDEVPAAQSDPKLRGRTRLRPPDRRAREALLAMVAFGRWDAVLQQSEGLLRHNPLWLETCWCSARALQELGEDHGAALAVVEAESRALIARLPQLLELQFMDGTPFASSEAAAWLRIGKGESEAAADPAREAWTAALQAALTGNEPANQQRVDTLLRAAPSLREGFEMRLQLAKIMEEAGRLDAAGYVYLGLEREIDRHDLEAWDPTLAITVFTRLCSLLERRALTVSAADAQRVRARLAKLSPFAL